MEKVSILLLRRIYALLRRVVTLGKLNRKLYCVELLREEN